MGKYDVGGVSLDRPWVRRLGHVGLFLDDLPAARRLYSDDLGSGVTDEMFLAPGQTQGYFMSNNADHHAVVCIDGAVGRMAGDAHDCQSVRAEPGVGSEVLTGAACPLLMTGPEVPSR